MSQLCKHCRSAETESMTDGYVCLICGKVTKYADPDRPGR
jgi:hypothetical protein